MSPSGPQSARYKHVFPLNLPSQLGYPRPADKNQSNRHKSEELRLDEEIPAKSACLVSYLADHMTLDDHSGDGIKDRILDWMVLNAHVTFKTSIKFSIDHWAFIDCCIPHARSDRKFLDHRYLLEAFLDTLITKLRQFDKAKAELAMALDSRSSNRSGTTDGFDSMRRYKNDWRRLRHSLESLHTIVELRLQ